MLWHSPFKAKDEVIVTEKLDGENTTMYRDHIHARSIDSGYHWSRTWVKEFWATHIAHQIPENIRIVGENMYAVHSIRYDDLKSYFYGISVWEDDLCLDWPTTLDWFDSLGIEPVPVIGWDFYEKLAMDKALSSLVYKDREGYVIRKAGSFKAADFADNVAKYVRPGHVAGNAHWASATMVDKNGLA